MRELPRTETNKKGIRPSDGGFAGDAFGDQRAVLPGDRDLGYGDLRWQVNQYTVDLIFRYVVTIRSIPAGKAVEASFYMIAQFGREAPIRKHSIRG